MRILAIAAAALFMASAAYAQDTSGASKSHMNNPQAAPEKSGGTTSTTGASKSHKANPKDMPAKSGSKKSSETGGKYHGKATQQ